MITYENFEFRVDNVLSADEQEVLQRVMVIREVDSGMIMRFPLSVENAQMMADALTAPYVIIAESLPENNGNHP